MIESDKFTIARDLAELAVLLNSHKLCGDTAPLYKAHGKCLNNSTDTYWSYEISQLIFRISSHSHIVPSGADDLSVSLSVNATGVYNEKIEIKNPLKELEFNIIITGGYIDKNDTYTELLAAWHLDKHLPQNEDELTKFIHPEYHMTFGGRKIWSAKYDYGQSIIFPTPRLCHPPMDGILGIDFVLHNYIERKFHYRLTDGLDYKRIMKRAQERMWRPYYLAIANLFQSQENVSFAQCIKHDLFLPNVVFGI